MPKQRPICSYDFYFDLSHDLTSQTNPTAIFLNEIQFHFLKLPHTSPVEAFVNYSTSIYRHIHSDISQAVNESRGSIEIKQI